MRRTAKLVLVLLLLAAVKPALALLNRPDDSQQTTVISLASPAAGASAENQGLASAATTTGFDDALPTDKRLADLQVTAALVQELGAPAPLFAYRANARWPLASVTKLTTAAVALDALGPAAIITISPEAVATEGQAGNLKVDERYSVIDLVRMMLTVSSNDAAIALAEAYDKKQLGSEAYEQELNKTALFTKAMQEKARAIGMPETYYGDPSGLSVVNQSVVTDLNTLLNYVAANHPEILTITRSKTNTVARRNKSGTIVERYSVTNINKLAGQADFLGGKTGETDEAGGNLISLFSYNGKKYVIIVLGASDAQSRFTETEKLYDWLKTQSL